MKHTKYTAFNKIVHRTPLLSFNSFEKILCQLNKNIDDISVVLNNKTIQEAIYLGSPLLYEEILKFIDSKITDQKEIESLRGLKCLSCGNEIVHNYGTVNYPQCIICGNENADDYFNI